MININKAGQFVCLEIEDEENRKNIFFIESYNVQKREKEIPEYIIQELFDAAFQLARMNNKPDVDTLYELYDAFLNDSEQVEFKKMIDAK
jgi:tryptophanyl-tRNA synthetase